MNQHVSEIFNISKQIAHLRIYLRSFTSILLCADGSYVESAEVGALLEPFEEGLEQVEKRMDRLWGRIQHQTTSQNYLVVKSKIQNRELKPTIRQLRKRYHLTKRTAAAYLLVMANEGVIVERSGQYRLNK